MCCLDIFLKGLSGYEEIFYIGIEQPTYHMKIAF